MEYNYKDIQDFLNDDTFVQWVLFGQNNIFWEQFLIDYPMKEDLITEARELIEGINEIQGEELKDLDQQLVWDRISKGININETFAVPALQIWQRSLFRWAACIIVLFGIGSLVWRYRPNDTVSYQDLVTSIDERTTLIEKINESEVPLIVHLEDGSVITLEKNSRLSYPIHFDKNKRTVILSGDAFFQIAKNPTKPFYVYANEIVTKVLGTSFRIQAFDEGKKVVVKVRSGRVSVFNQRRVNLSDPETDGLVLVPNQQAIYNRSDKNLTKRLVESPLPLMQNSPLQFDEASIHQIFKAVENRYGVKIMYNEEVLSGCYLTAKLSDESLYDQLDLICKIIGGTYKEVDGQIVIDSKGCN